MPSTENKDRSVEQAFGVAELRPADLLRKPKQKKGCNSRCNPSTNN